jgi:prophage DNA circulation protein
VTGDEAEEILGITRRIGPVILSAAVSPTGDIGTSLRRAVGMMMVDVSMTHLPTFAFAFGVCLDLCRHSQATLATMDRVRKALLAEQPVGLPAVLTKNVAINVVLAVEARIVAYMTFQSREEVNRVADAMNAAFTEAETIASDDCDQGSYMVMVSLHGTVVKFLADRGRMLPRVISYNYQMVMPALRMAQLAYANPKTYQELINENQVVHPAFMPTEGKMLARI